VCLIEDYGVIFHTSYVKNELIIHDIKNMKFAKFISFEEDLVYVLKHHYVVQGTLMMIKLWFTHEKFKLEFMRVSPL
jgi:hypothetical protein